MLIVIARRDFIGGLSALSLVGCATPHAGEKPVVRFGYITDCHYAAHLEPSLDRRYKESLGKMETFVNFMNILKPDFVVEGGDFKDLGRTKEESLAYLDSIEAEFAKFKGDRYHVLGNHDHDNLSKEEFLAHVHNAGQDVAKAYYSFVRNGVTFIVLDANYGADGEPYCRGNFSWKTAKIPAEQVGFLKEQLALAPGPVVPILHQQLDAKDETRIRNAKEIKAILKMSRKVKFVLQGHYHEGMQSDLNGIHYYTCKASVIGPAPDQNAFCLVSVYADGSCSVAGYRSADFYK